MRHSSAMERYCEFIDGNPQLASRLKQHHIAAYLGITPESLSRMKKERDQSVRPRSPS